MEFAFFNRTLFLVRVVSVMACHSACLHTFAGSPGLADVLGSQTKGWHVPNAGKRLRSEPDEGDGCGLWLASMHPVPGDPPQVALGCWKIGQGNYTRTCAEMIRCSEQGSNSRTTNLANLMPFS